jgi:ribonuclease HI
VPARGDNSNNVAEYQAFGWTITKLLEIIPAKSTIAIFGDSKLVVCQMRGEWKMKQGAYLTHARKAKEMLKRLCEKCDIFLQWIPREQNGIADELSKRCMIKNNVEFRIQPNP